MAEIRWAVAVGLACMGCPRPAVPGGGATPVMAVTGEADGLRLVDLRGVAEPRELLLGGGWSRAAWVGCTDWVALDRTLGEERSLSVLDVESGQLIAVGARPVEELMREPAILDALVAAFGVEAAYPEDRLQYGALRSGQGGRPVVEVIGAGEGEEPDVVVGIEPIALPAPVEREVGDGIACVGEPPIRWVMRSPYGVEALGGEPAEWACERVAGSGPETHDSRLTTHDSRHAHQSRAKEVGVSAANAADLPLVVDVPGAGEVALPGRAPVEGYELCARPGGGWRAVRVEQPGEYGYDVLYVVRDGDGAVWEAARYEVTDLEAAGVGVVGGNLLLFGGPAGWFVARDDDDPERVSDMPPAIR
ncbi:MAG: hypothetical protein HY905_09175 [Deltaproteobacteria bacterium]|nr:hypothetical protein [Deltaproteobacteria bacterium]